MKKRLSRLTFAGLLLSGLLAGFGARAQVFDPNATPARTSAEIMADTTERREVVVTPAAKRQKAAADSAKRTERMFRAFGFQGIRLTRPGKAAMLALVLPGAGQIYNRRWWKLPLVYGAVGGTIAGEIFYQQRYNQFAKAYNNVTQRAINPDTGIPYRIGDTRLGPQASKVTSVTGLDANVVFFRGYRDIFYLYIGIAYSLQIVDALVDAHLQDFDVSNDLSLHWQPQLLPTPGQPGALPTNPGVLFALRIR
ncbi:DUF5683 domain-containing protein [Hymenobacter sp. DH14]|uniref:DUF5683 domain-containing protein n=1 Tax=Hymenobacter cyanobacteriorum TaxID=2926463 RepID=A0A9X1VCW3_9BACT|nr:DUF5683 domain-containing protein [Hymenobacter cyanobacteriorum]MCI1186268.1 DUF5683 domain-containing protein [Hymenobacter cyanobacteriorum]